MSHGTVAAIRRIIGLDDGTANGALISTGRNVSATLGSADAILIEGMAMGVVQVLGSPSAVNVNIYACNDPGGANPTYTQLYDEFGAAVQIPLMASGHWMLPAAACCCKAIKLVAASGSDFKVTVFLKG